MVACRLRGRLARDVPRQHRSRPACHQRPVASELEIHDNPSPATRKLNARPVRATLPARHRRRGPNPRTPTPRPFLYSVRMRKKVPDQHSHQLGAPEAQGEAEQESAR